MVRGGVGGWAAPGGDQDGPWCGTRQEQEDAVLAGAWLQGTGSASLHGMKLQPLFRGFSLSSLDAGSGLDFLVKCYSTGVVVRYVFTPCACLLL